jgi:hypothetical protein
MLSGANGFAYDRAPAPTDIKVTLYPGSLPNHAQAVGQSYTMKGLALEVPAPRSGVALIRKNAKKKQVRSRMVQLFGGKDAVASGHRHSARCKK